jgi:hypothetical protein
MPVVVGPAVLEVEVFVVDEILKFSSTQYEFPTMSLHDAASDGFYQFLSNVEFQNPWNYSHIC